MATSNFSRSLLTDRSPEAVYQAVTDVDRWWSELIEGKTAAAGDEFIYRHKDLHYSKQKLTESVPGQRVVWLVTNSRLSFIDDQDEWTGTTVHFDISRQGDKTKLVFTHEGLIPQLECYDACSKGWTYYTDSLFNLISKGEGFPDPGGHPVTTQAVADRFNELAQQEKWFEIQDELFADDVKSIEPPTTKHSFSTAGKAAVRKKGEDWVKRVTDFHSGQTTAPVVAGNFFVVGRQMDITVEGIGRMAVSELMMYEVREGKIISEQFFY